MKRRAKKISAGTGSVDPETLDRMKREIQSLSAHMAAAEAHNREREIYHAHKKQQREDIREGRRSRPFYLKKSQVKREVEREKVEKMGKRAREKREVRKRKREKGKEGRGMPRVRRVRDW